MSTIKYESFIKFTNWGKGFPKFTNWGKGLKVFGQRQIINLNLYFAKWNLDSDKTFMIKYH